MISVTVFQNGQGDIIGIDSIGHAGYDAYGKDIVCAAVSVLTINAIASVETLVGDKFSLLTDEGKGELRFKLDGKPKSGTKLLLDSLVLGLKGIENQYGKRYLKLRFEEV